VGGRGGAVSAGGAAAGKWFDGAARVLFVHAHPDDETISTGGTLAGLADAGRAPMLATLTRGERGEVVPGPRAGLQGTPALASHRETELAAALSALGVAQHAYLGRPPARARGLEPRRYEDSGMRWGPDRWAVAAPDAPEAALTRSPAVEALGDLIALAVEWNAEALVGYDANGGYGHPDHVFAHRAARAVAQALELPFWQVETADADPLRNAGTAPVGPAAEARFEAEDHDVSPWLERKVRALRAHATQLTVEGEEIVHVGGQREPIDAVERFRRLD